MQWARFRSKDGRAGFGVLEGEEILEYDGDLFGAPRSTGRAIVRQGVDLEAPCAPSKVIAVWNNFHALAAKIGKAAPTHPLFLIKPGTSVIGPLDKIERPRSYSGKIVFEGELAIVIGKRCKDVSPAAALDHVFGFTCVNDVTAAELIDENRDFAQWCRSKAYDTFCSLGPVISTKFDWRNARVVTRLDGVERQNYPLSDMIMTPADLVSRISADMTLLPGDVIACGTSLGVGSIKEGVTIEVFIEGIGSLSNALAHHATG